MPLRSTELILEAAKITEQRKGEYGDKLQNHSNIANLWTAYLVNKFGPGFVVDPHDVANMMELLKVARRQLGPYNADHYVDGAGYAGVAGEIAEELDRRKKEMKR